MLTDNQKTPGLMELHCVLAAEATSPEHPAHDYFRRRYASLRDEATAAFEAMAARGELTNSIDPASLAATIIGVVDGLQLQWLLDRESIDLESAVRAFVRTAIPAVR